MLLDYDAPNAWPSDVTAYLAEHAELFDDWLGDQTFATPNEYDEIVRGLTRILASHKILAWHCTRLTQKETQHILSDGMSLPDLAGLKARIDGVLAEGAISASVAEQFKHRHQADSPTRVGRIWFLFTRPRNDDGVSDFLRFWGGESLYAAIDRDPELGPVLRAVGAPSVVEAAIPAAYFPDSLGYEMHLMRMFLAWHSGNAYSGVPHDRIVEPLPLHCIRRIVAYPSAEFRELTGCDSFYEPLTLGADT